MAAESAKIHNPLVRSPLALLVLMPAFLANNCSDPETP
jgi:hypothetical protein